MSNETQIKSEYVSNALKFRFDHYRHKFLLCLDKLFYRIRNGLLKNLSTSPQLVL